MRTPIKKSFLLIASILVISVLFNSIVYACSGFASVSMALHGSANSGNSMQQGTVERGPCAEHKHDICQSVRARMLSTQISLSKADDARPLLVAPLPLVIDVIEQTVLPSGPLDLKVFYHPVFKLSLPLSLLVLRI
jgi:hypothetical protein